MAVVAVGALARPLPAHAARATKPPAAALAAQPTATKPPAAALATQPTATEAAAALATQPTSTEAAAALATQATATEAADPEAADYRARWSRGPDADLAYAWLRWAIGRGDRVQARRVADVIDRALSNAPVVRAELGYFWFADQQFRRAQLAFAQALLGSLWTPEQRHNLMLARAAAAEEASEFATAVGVLQALAVGGDPKVLHRLARVYMADRNRPAALAVARGLRDKARSPAEREEALALLNELLRPPTATPAFRLLIRAYRELLAGDDAAAERSFALAFSRGAGAAFHFADAAYAAKRLGDATRSVAWFKFALDLDRDDRTFTPTQFYNFRREIETLERTWGAAIGTPWHAGQLQVAQAAADGWWQPPRIGFNNGRTLQVTGRFLVALRNGAAGVTGWPTLMAAPGLRVKPLTRWNFVAAVERLFDVGGSATSDWLIRMGLSEGTSTDVRPVLRHWPDWQVFAEANAFIGQRRILAGTEGRAGWSVAGPRWQELIWTPHLVVVGEYDSAAVERWVAGLGPGLSLRAWFDADETRAPRRWLELRASYRWGVGDRVGGASLNATLGL